MSGTNINAGSEVYSAWIDNVQWVRNILILGSSDQQYDIKIYRRDSSLQSDWGSTVVSTQTATGSGTFRPSTATMQLGYSVRFSIKNSSASANTFGQLRIQLMGQ